MFTASICVTTCATVVNAVSAPPEYVTQDNDYTYVYQEINGVTWVFVYDKEGNLVTAYPEQ